MGLRGSVKRLARDVVPGVALERLEAMRSRRAEIRLLQSHGVLEAGKRYVERYGTVVRHGPFAGLIYPLDSALNQHSIPKLMGTYESELFPALEQVLNRKYDLALNVGCADGYYAVGLARTLGIKVLAYDPDPNESALCGLMARINGVGELVERRSLFTAPDLDQFRDQRCLLVCDCEGFEARLFTAETVGKTAKWDVLIELHGETRATLPALPWPQRQTLIWQEHRGETYPELELIGESGPLLSEYRGDRQLWLWGDATA